MIRTMAARMVLAEMANSMSCNTTNNGNLSQGRRENPSVGGAVRLNLPEFPRLISSSIVTDHYLFQCRKAML